MIPEEKKIKFKVLREIILASKTATLKTLLRFAGKAVSFSLAIAGCKLYFRETFKAVAGLVSNSKPTVKVTGLLQSELEYWRFLNDWSDCLPWRSERHVTVTLYCDASKRAYGGILMTGNGTMKAGDYWQEESGRRCFVLWMLSSQRFEIPAPMFTRIADLSWGHGRTRVDVAPR